MRKRELIERIKKLEQKNTSLEKAVRFLSNNNKDDIAITLHTRSMFTVGIEYLYNGNVECVEVPNATYEVIRKEKEYLIVCGTAKSWTFLHRYYKIDMANAIVEEIPKPAFVLEQELADEKSGKTKTVVYTNSGKIEATLPQKENESGNKKRTKGSKQAK